VTDGPLIVQSDKTLLLEVDHPDALACRMAIAPFAELERSPEHVHTYRLTPLGLWNARAAGHDAESVVDALLRFSRYPVPHALLVDVAETMDRYGRLQLVNDPAHGLVLRATDRAVLLEVSKSKKLADMLGTRIDADTIAVHPVRARPAQAGAAEAGLAGRGPGRLRRRRGAPDRAAGGRLAPAQLPAAGGGPLLGRRLRAWSCCPAVPARRWSGRPAMAEAGATTLILVTNTVAGRQWKRELIARTSLTESEIGEYSGERKEIRPVTIATYQVLTTRRGGVFTHLDLFGARDWGLVIYDEVHLLPAPIFRFTADLQARRRLGLTATLVREDGREGDVFSLIGPKRYDAPWKDIEAQGWIAPAECVEVRVTLTDAERMAYATAETEERYRFAATARTKLPVVRKLVERHQGDQILVIGAYLDQLHELGEFLDAPIIQGATTNRERERLFDAFRSGEAVHTGHFEGRQLLHRPARGGGGDPGVGDVRLAAGGGAAPRPGTAPQGGRAPGPLLHRSSRGTRSTPSTRRTGSGSWPSRATPTRSSTPTTCWDRRCPPWTEFLSERTSAFDPPVRHFGATRRTSHRRTPPAGRMLLGVSDLLHAWRAALPASAPDGPRRAVG
jgi:DNA excision repair protein ERCC-3